MTLTLFSFGNNPLNDKEIVTFLSLVLKSWLYRGEMRRFDHLIHFNGLILV